MFIYSLKANTLKFFGLIGIALIVLFSLIFFIPDFSVQSTSAIAMKNEKINFEKIKTNEDRIKFLEQFGWQVKPDPIEEAEIKIPAEFDRVMNTYNELQKQQGLNLEKFKNKEMMRYTYEITNYPNYTGKVMANLIIYKNRVVGGDICSSDVNGFITGFTMPAQ